MIYGLPDELDEFNPVRVLEDWSDTDYGFMVIEVRDTRTGATDVYIEYWDEPEEGQKKYEVYRVEVEDDVMADLDWVEWEDVARSAGQTLQDLQKAATGNLRARLHVYRDVAGHHGWHELDNYPLILSKKEMKLRWPDAFDD